MPVQVLNLVHPFIHSSSFSPINISVEKGCALAVCGNNGAGKTTFLKLLLGDIQPKRGSIQLDQEFSYLGIKNGMKAGITLKHQLSFYLKGDLEFPWPQFMDKLYGDLSSGQQRMISLWIALFSKEKSIVLLDEPFSHLDLNHKKIACEWFETQLDLKKTIIFTHHNAEDLKGIKSLKIVDLNLEIGGP